MRVTRFLLPAALVGMALAPACSGGDDRPPCNLGNCFGDGDADADTDADSDADADGDSDIDCFDADGDGHIDYRCEGGDDCDDADREIHPGVDEVCNGIDDDCSGGVDDQLLVDGADVVVAPVHSAIGHIALAADADGFGLLRLEQDVANDWHLLFSELDAGHQVRGEPIVVSDSPNYLYYETLALVALPDRWLVAYCDVGVRGPGARAGLLTLATIEAGSASAGPVIGDPSETTDQMPAAAVGATTVALTWQHNLDSVLYAVLDQETLEVVQQGDLGDVHNLNGARPSVVWTSDHYLVAFVDDRWLMNIVEIDEAGDFTVDSRTDAGSFALPSIAWDGFEAAVARTDTLGNMVSEFAVLDEAGIVAATTSLDLFKTPSLVGSPRAFALTGVTSVARETYRGAPRFAVLGPIGGVLNEVSFDDSSSGDAIDTLSVPAGDGWVVAWIDDGGGARVDRVGCP